VKTCTLLSVYSELERLKEENWRLEKQCNCVTRQLELATYESKNETKVSQQSPDVQLVYHHHHRRSLRRSST